MLSWNSKALFNRLAAKAEIHLGEAGGWWSNLSRRSKSGSPTKPSAEQKIICAAEKKKASTNAGLTLCFVWWACTDLNRGPKDYEAVKSTFLVVSLRLPKKADLARYLKFKGLGVSPWFWVWPVMP